MDTPKPPNDDELRLTEAKKAVDRLLESAFHGLADRFALFAKLAAQGKRPLGNVLND